MGDSISMTDKEPDTIELWNMAIFKPTWWKPWYTAFYIDCPQFLSFNSFDNHGVRPFWMRFHESDSIKYVGILCRIRKSQLDDFLVCMEELQRNILICGYTDYEEFCQEWQKEIAEEDEDDD